MSSANPALPLRFLRLRGGLRALSLRLYAPSASPLPLPLSFSTSDPSAQAFIIHQVHIGESIRTLELTPESTLAGLSRSFSDAGRGAGKSRPPARRRPALRRFICHAVTWRRYLAPLPGVLSISVWFSHFCGSSWRFYRFKWPQIEAGTSEHRKVALLLSEKTQVLGKLPSGASHGAMGPELSVGEPMHRFIAV